MTFLPIVARELRVASRRYATYWSRALMATLTIIAGIVVYVDAGVIPPHELGVRLFWTLCGAAYVYCLAAGIPATADCLSEEKRDGTLGLLFLTDLKGYDVVGGKLVASSLKSFFGLVAIFPVLAIPLLMGGVTKSEVGRATLVLSNTCLLSLCIGMFMSSICASGRKAMAATLVAMLGFSLGIPAIEEWVPFVRESPDLTYALQIINPNVPFALIGETDYRAAINGFWYSTGAIFGLSCLCLALASFIVPRTWQDNPPGAKARRWRDQWRAWAFGEGPERLAFRKRLLDINAFFWLAARARLKPAYVWTALTGIACLWSWGAIEDGSDWLNIAVYFTSILVLNTTLKIWVASEAGRRLGEDRRAGTLELILSTPMKVEEIMGGQMLALKRQFLGPLLAVLVAEGILLSATLRVAHADSDDITAGVSSAVGCMIMLVADLMTLSYLGMWASLTAKNPLRATGIALRRVLVLPWAIIGAVCLFVTLFMRRVGSYNPSWKSFLALYLVTGLLVDIGYGFMAWRMLLGKFRETAAMRFQMRRSIWSRLLGRRKPELVA